jgi:hypothetical protein
MSRSDALSSYSTPDVDRRLERWPLGCRNAENTETCSECRFGYRNYCQPATGAASQRVAEEPEPRCQASTGIAHVWVVARRAASPHWACHPRELGLLPGAPVSVSLLRETGAGLFGSRGIRRQATRRRCFLRYRWAAKSLASMWPSDVLQATHSSPRLHLSHACFWPG